MTRRYPKISASVLSADSMHLGDEITAVVQAGSDYVHLDIMDGHFVPNLTFGAHIVSAIHRLTSAPLDVHLMVENINSYLEPMASAGASIITVHPEAGPHLHRTLSRIRELGCKAGVALNPGTSLSTIESILPAIDLLLIMTVNPGFGGQFYIPYMTQKIEAARSLIDASGFPILLEVDGGIHSKTAALAVNAGADILVAGTAIFSPSPQQEDKISQYTQRITNLRGV